jgi:hypothetical protein
MLTTVVGDGCVDYAAGQSELAGVARRVRGLAVELCAMSVCCLVPRCSLLTPSYLAAQFLILSRLSAHWPCSRWYPHALGYASDSSFQPVLSGQPDFKLIGESRHLSSSGSGSFVAGGFTPGGAQLGG